MKSVCLSLPALLLLSFAASAQTAPTITATSNLQDGDVNILYFTDTVIVTPPAANTTWHYDTLHLAIVDTDHTVACSVSPYCSSFPGSELYGYTASHPDDQEFYHMSPTAQTVNGYYNTTVIDFTNPEDMVRYPFTYNSYFADTFDGVFSTGGYTYHRWGTVTVRGDAWGTLYLPGATYTNALRVKTIESFNDTTISGGSSYVWMYNITSYSWLVPNLHMEVLATSVTRRQGSIIGTSHYYTHRSTIGVTDVKAANTSVTIYPNPATDQVHVTSGTPFQSGSHADIFTIDGKHLFSYPLTGSDAIIPTVELPRGLYQLMIHQQGIVPQMKKLVVER